MTDAEYAAHVQRGIELGEAGLVAFITGTICVVLLLGFIAGRVMRRG